jgi:cell fate regulator YaaT (PSP1 superfamily)
MVEIIGVRFRKNGKIYYFSPQGEKIKTGTKVIVETVRGVECGEVALDNRLIKNKDSYSEVKPIIRIANQADLEKEAANREKEKEALKYCEERVIARGLKMKLVDVEITFDNRKLLFYFTAENRVDFRELVKDLASVFRTRIELRQIGVRDEAKVLGGLGVCGREFCCKSCIRDFQPVSIKMAKEQGLSLNPGKISGACGRLMCCLKYEQNVYDELLRITPKCGALVQMESGGKGKVIDVNILTGTLKIMPDGSDIPVTLDKSKVKLIKDAQIRVDKSELKALRDLEDK